MFSCRRYTACSSPFHFWCAIFLFVYDNVWFCVVCACVNLFSYKNWLNFVILLLIARFGWYHLWDVLRVQVLRSFSKFSTDLSKLIIFFIPSTLSFLVFLFSISLNCCFYMFCTLLTGSLIATFVWLSFDAIGDMRWQKKYVIFLAVVFLHGTISFSDQKTSN